LLIKYLKRHVQNRTVFVILGTRGKMPK